MIKKSPGCYQSRVLNSLQHVFFLLPSGLKVVLKARCSGMPVSLDMAKWGRISLWGLFCNQSDPKSWL